MSKVRSLWLFLLPVLIVGCAGPATPSTAPTTPLPSPTPTINASAPESVGRAFLSAWEAGAYAQMYNLLSPSLRSGLAQENFEKAYRVPLNTTTTLSLTLLPQQLGIEASHAWIDFEESWMTSLFGTLQATNRLHMVKEDGQWWVDWRRETIWPDLADGNAFAVEYQTPPRANIYDRNGAGLAIPSTIVTVGVIPDKIQDEGSVLNALSQALGLTLEELQAKYVGQPTSWFIPLGDISGEESLAYEVLLNQAGIERRERSGRLYPLDGVGAHVVGWVSSIPEESLDEYRRRGYRDDAWVGISGLEAWGESTLAGKNGGRLSLIKSDGTYLRGLVERQPERGRAIFSTLDRDLQEQAEQILGNRAGAIVAMDVASGAILAMASGPDFDNNAFVRPTDQWQLQGLLNDPARPLLNRATQGSYPCGSVFKIITLAAALESGNATEQSSFFCPGYWDGLGVANRKTCWSTTGHGSLGLKDGLIVSCDVVFYELGHRLDGADPDILPTYGKAFGFGAATGLQEIPENSGLMPDNAWKQETYAESWATGDSVNLAIGQGFILVTPLQMVRAYAAVANGGTLYSPYLVARIAEGNGLPEQVTAPQATGQLPISAANLALIQDGLRQVTTRSDGTATYRFQGLNVAVAGKTGTAQAPGETSLPHSWFAGYFPAEAPEIAMVVMVENAGEGSTVAAPMFRQVVEAHYGLPLTPLPTAEAVPQGD